MLSLLVNSMQHKKYTIFAKKHFPELINIITPITFSNKLAFDEFSVANKDKMLLRLPADLLSQYKEKALDELALSREELAETAGKNIMPSLFIKPNAEFSEFMKRVDLESKDIGSHYYLSVIKMIHGRQIKDGNKELNLNISLNFTGKTQTREVGIIPNELIGTLENKIVDAIKMNLTNNVYKPEPILRKNAPRL